MLNIQKNLSRSFFAVLSLPATAMGFALSVQISALSWILATKYGLEIHDIGLVWAAGPIAGIFGQVIIGAISDKVWFWSGRRRPFIIIGGLLASLMLLALPSIDVISAALGFHGVLGVAIAIVLSLDVAINVGFNPTRAIIADVTPEGDDRTRGFTWMQTVSGTVSVGAYAIGAIFDNIVLIYVGAALVLLFTLLPPLLIEEPLALGKVDDTAASAPKSSLRDILLHIQPLWGFLVYDIYAMTLRLAGISHDHYYAEIVCGTLTAFLVLRALTTREQGLAPGAAAAVGFRKVLSAHSFSWIGIHTTFVFMFIFVQDALPGLDGVQAGRVTTLAFLVLNAVAAILPVFVLGPLAIRLGRVRVHAASLFIMTLGYLALLLLDTSAAVIYVAMAVVGVGWASMISLPFAIMSQKADQAQMGLFMGLFNLSVVLPQLVVSLGVSLAVSRAADKDIIFLISTVALALSAVAWLLVSDEAPTIPENA
ncbi:MAG: MFS transporter [Lysobacterales bacterium]|jgi:MFS family permease